MARKLRTGFEFPRANGGSDLAVASLISTTFMQDKFGDIIEEMGRVSVIGNSVNYVAFANTYQYRSTGARTLNDGTRGGFINVGNTNGSAIKLSTTEFTSGIFANWWSRVAIINTNDLPLGRIVHNSITYACFYRQSTGEVIIHNGTSDVGTGSLASYTASTYYNCQLSINSTGTITVQFNGVSASYATGVSYSSVNTTEFMICGTYSGVNGNSNGTIDDLAINDGSGASDNSMPSSIRGYNFFDAATLNANSGFSAVGGTTVLANLQDGDDSTRISASADLSYLDFSLPTLSGTGMAETAANFTKIEAINVYGRQIEATKASSLLKAKVTDTVAVVNREENLTLPLTVGNDSVTMFNDGSSDWVLANLDSGDMDFRVTFDKP